MKMIHFTVNPIESLETREYNQKDLAWQAKPNGLWFSIEGLNAPNNICWKEWCKSENFRTYALAFSYEIILKEDANILHLKTSKEIVDFTNKYPLKSRDWEPEHDTYQLQWDEVKKKYQGIIIAPYNWECRLEMTTCWYYGWDCSSGCIWDIDCIKEFKFLTANGNE